MATQVFRYSGICKWARLRENNLSEFPGDDKGKYASIDFSFNNPEEEKAFNSLKTKKEFKTDEENGRSYVNFRRFVVNEAYPSLGGLPKVVDANGDAFDGLIGNGSSVTVKIEVYDTRSGRKGTRLIAVRVDDLVEFNKDSDLRDSDMPF